MTGKLESTSVKPFKPEPTNCRMYARAAFKSLKIELAPDSRLWNVSRRTGLEIGYGDGTYQQKLAKVRAVKEEIKARIQEAVAQATSDSCGSF